MGRYCDISIRGEKKNRNNPIGREVEKTGSGSPQKGPSS